MPLIGIVGYALLRQIAMAVASGAVVTFAQELFEGTFKELVFELRDTENITEQEAKDVVGNILLDLAINSASIMAVLKFGVGVKLAEWLGLTSRKFAPAALSAAAKAATVKVAADGGKSMAKRILGKLVKLAGKGTGVFWLFAALTQIIEPLWYQPGQIQRVLQSVGLDVSVPGATGTQMPGPFSADSSVTFSDFAKSIETAGVKGIENPGTYRSELYTRDGLANLVNYVYGQQLLLGKNLKVAELLPLISKYLVGASFTTSIPSPTTSVTTTPSIPKVYTGIVSQGVIGKGLSFTPRPDDLIESVEELRQAAANNLAPFLETILGKIIYEVKIVSSIITKDGFKQTGTVQQIRSGTTATGAPKYKTVVNKFATLNLYVMSDKGVRSRISTIVLGPTNSAKLTVGINDIREVETSLPSLVTTTNINEITGIETAQSVTVSTPKTEGGTSVPTLDTGSVVTSASPVSTPGQATPVAGNNALTLFDWYRAQGQALASVEERSYKYEELGLGTRSFYTGTAEQNSKLLAALKREAATPKAPAPAPAATPTAPKVGNTVALSVAKVGDPKKYSGGRVTEYYTQADIDKRDEPEEKRVLRSYTTADGFKVTKYSDGSETRVVVKK